MNSKKKLSGAENRKRKLELEKNVQKLPKIDNFFSKTEKVIFIPVKINCIFIVKFNEFNQG